MTVRHGGLSVLDGSTFVLGDDRGDIVPAPARPDGFFHDDTRFVNRWELRVGGELLEPLSVARTGYFAIQFFLMPASGPAWEPPRLSVVRRRAVRGSWVEEIELINHGDARQIHLAIAAEADFADLFEVKDAAVRGRDVERVASGRQLLLSYRRGDFLRATRITVGGADCEARDDGFDLTVELAARETRRVTFEVRPHGEQPGGGRPARPPAGSWDGTLRELQADVDAWVAAAPAIDTDWDALRAVYARSLVDLAALRIYPDVDGDAVPAAGLPWFMALFGRDSLIASYQALPFRPELARATLRALAARQATEVDDFRDAEPGKILHELRFGELTVFGDWPHSPYYGTADATPLFLVLLDEYERWTGDTALARALEPAARAALAWIDEHGDLDGDGYVEYRRRNDRNGLDTQCWKDSPNAILFADGSRAGPPIAPCEVQGYVYDAKLRCARLADEIWGDPELAGRLRHQAADLRRRFHTDFWVEERGFYALALDGEKRRVDSLTSNTGHLLWSGIVDAEPAARLADHLAGDDLFSGWGVRTMAAGEAGYNPLEYHNGTVWPHDTSLIAHGLGRYGHRDEAGRLTAALVEAAAEFTDALPEVFAGYPRASTGFPVEYPTASRPQAWSSGATLLGIRTVLGLEPDGDGPTTDAALPEPIGRLALRGIPGRWGRGDASATSGRPPRAPDGPPEAARPRGRDAR
jgi:glycogen debranching enzyme